MLGGHPIIIAHEETKRLLVRAKDPNRPVPTVTFADKYRLEVGTKVLELDALLVIDGDKTEVGKPTVTGVKVSAKVVEDLVKGEKIRVIRYKAKKRVHKENGHRQKYSKIEIVSIK